MDIEAGSALEATRVGLVLRAWAAAQNELFAVLESGALGELDDLGLVEVLRCVERVRNRAALIDHIAITEALQRRLPESLSQPSMAGVLVWALRLSRGEASRRVRAAEQLAPRRAMTGEPLEPVRPALATAQREGAASPEQVDICLRALGSVDHRGFDPAELEAADGLLAQFAATFPPAELRQLATGLVTRIDPDGTLPDDQVQKERRHLGLRRTRDGMWQLEGRLTGAVGAKLSAVLSPLAAPRVETVVLGEGRDATVPDPRAWGQRLHDAVEEVCDRLLRSGTMPYSGGVPTTLVITVAEEDLAARRGHGTTSDGTLVPMGTVLRLADQANLVTTVLSPTGGVRDFGRTRRCASPSQTLALVARDRGCSFPGCNRPPEWCERHHVIAWIDGGPTNLDNLTLLCAYHHHQFEARGWACRMVEGLPTWTPPRWVDPQQRPLRNSRITAATTERQRELLRC